MNVAELIRGILGTFLLALTILWIMGLINPNKIIGNPNIKHKRLIYSGAWVVILFVFYGISMMLPTNMIINIPSRGEIKDYTNEIIILRNDSIELSKMDTIEITIETKFLDYKANFERIDSMSKPLARLQLKNDSSIIRNNRHIAALCENNTINGEALKQRLMASYRPYMLHAMKEKYNSRWRNVSLSADEKRVIFYDRNNGANSPWNRRAIVNSWKDRLLLSGIEYVYFDFGDKPNEKETRSVKYNNDVTSY